MKTKKQHKLPSYFHDCKLYLECGDPEPMRNYCRVLYKTIDRIRRQEKPTNKTWVAQMVSYYQTVLDNALRELEQIATIPQEETEHGKPNSKGNKKSSR